MSEPVDESFSAAFTVAFAVKTAPITTATPANPMRTNKPLPHPPLPPLHQALRRDSTASNFPLAPPLAFETE